MAELAALVAAGPALNRQWLASPAGQASFLAGYVSHFAGFADTNCEVTGMMLRERLAPGRCWKLLPEGTYPLGELFQIELGPEWSVVEHFVTVRRSALLHSWYGRHPLVLLDCDPARLREPDAFSYLCGLLGLKKPYPAWILSYYVPSDN